MQHAQAIIKAENVSKVYDMGRQVQVAALKKINLEIGKGEFVSIIGQSGSGKTTLLDILSALLRPTHGEVYINGKPISKMSDSELAVVRGKTIGFIFQSFNLISRMSALENVMLPLWFQGVPAQGRKEIATKILQDVGLGDRMDHKPNELSGGQKQRVAIARALAVDPDIIVADEPTGNLDSKSGATILQLIENLNRDRGKTILIVTHERYVAERAQKIINIKDGEIISTEINDSENSRSVRRDYK
ncbi:MAG: ABC transporter ATP-binding protein [Candidatus Diapherotrites archaeon]|nr:ABC transporter ATP-binding protein [Candidatus Diapherotrites archaeon]